MTNVHQDDGARPTAFAYYALVLLMLAVFLSFLDRMILSFVIDPVRRDLQIKMKLGELPTR